METQPISAKLVIKGAFECRDADGVLLKTIELVSEIPLSELNQLEPSDDDQRSE